MLARRVGVSLPVLRACRRLAPPQLAQPVPLRAASCFRALSTQSGASQSSDAEQPSGGANGGAAGGAEAADKAEEADTPAAEGGADATDAGAGGEAAADLAAEQIASLQTQVEELQAKVDEKHDQLLRAVAETDNARKRAAVEVENAHKFAVGKFAKSLLDVADNLTRAMESVPEDQRASDENPALRGLYEGVSMTESVLLKVFAQNGLTRIDAMGAKFDPNIHNAMFEAPDPEKEAGTVMHVASAGYMLNERCLRPAGVGVVAKPPA